MQPELQQSNDADTSCKKNATLGSPIFPLQKKCNWDRGLQKKNEATTKLQKKSDVTDKVQKKTMWPAKCKKKRWNGQSAKKNAMWQTHCKKKAMWPAKCKKKVMGRAKCKKKAMERAKCKKNATGQLVVSRIWESSQQDETTKPRLAALVFFFCVCLCVCGSAYSSASEAMIRTARRVQYPAFLTCQHKTPQMHDWHVFF